MTAVAERTQGTAAPPSRYATGEQYYEIAAGYTAFASELLAMRELMPIRPRDLQVTCHLPDLETLRSYAAGLGMEAPQRMGGQWRSRQEFGPALTYILWTEVAK